MTVRRFSIARLVAMVAFLLGVVFFVAPPASASIAPHVSASTVPSANTSEDYLVCRSDGNGGIVTMYPYEAEDEGYLDPSSGQPKNGAWLCADGPPPTPDADGDGISDDLDDCDTVRNVTTGCDPDNDGVKGDDDLCPYESGPASHHGCQVVDPGPMPPPTYTEWSNEAPSCVMPVVTQYRMVTTVDWVLSEDESAWVVGPGGITMTTETQEVRLSDEELAACPTDPGHGPRPSDVVTTKTYDVEANCEAGTVKVMKVTKIRRYYLGKDNDWHLSDHPSTDRVVGSREMTADEMSACQPPAEYTGQKSGGGIEPAATPVAATTTQLPVTGAGTSGGYTASLLYGLMGVAFVAFLTAVALRARSN